VNHRSDGAGGLRSELLALIRGYQRDTDAFDQAVSERLGVNRTDMRCLDWLTERAASPGPITPTMLADATGLPPSTITSVLDRLEQAGYVRRVRDTRNRRQVLVELTPALIARVEEMFAPVEEDAAEQLSGFSAAELETLIRFFAGANKRHIHRLHRIRSAPGDDRRPDPQAIRPQEGVSR
jgi:DNA-binding MarR family transcriptional regulator